MSLLNPLTWFKGDKHKKATAKINELISRVNEFEPIKISSDYLLSPEEAMLDVFPSPVSEGGSGEITITCRPKADYLPSHCVFIPNNNYKNGLNVVVKDDEGNTLLTVGPKEAYYLYISTEHSGGEWDAISVTDGNLVELDVAIFGDMNAAQWGDLQTGKYYIAGNFGDFSNLSPNIDYQPTTPVICFVEIHSDPNIWWFELRFISGFEPANDDNLRPTSRGGLTWATSTGAPWKDTAFSSDVVTLRAETTDINANLMSVIKAMRTKGNLVHTVADGTSAPNPSGVINVVLDGNGGDPLLTPPTVPQPVTGGNYNGYQKVTGFVQDKATGEVSVVNGEFVIGSKGAGDYHADGWLGMGSSAANNNVGLVFAIERGGMLYFSQRPTGDKASSTGDLTNISGSGVMSLQPSDKMSMWICSEKPATIALYDANLRIKMDTPSELLNT